MVTPFEDIPGLRRDFSAADEAIYTAQMQRVEQQTAECMRSRGWDYRSAAPKLIEPGEPTSSTEENPNDAVLAQLAEAERAAWLYDLTGDSDHSEGSQTGPEPGSDPCALKSAQAVHFVSWIRIKLGDELDALQARVGSAPVVVAAKQEWSECMGDAGFAETASPSQFDRWLETRVLGLEDRARVDELYAQANAAQDTCDPALSSVVQKVRVDAEWEFIYDNAAAINQHLAALRAQLYLPPKAMENVPERV